MNKTILLALVISLFSISLLAQLEKNKPLVVVNGRISNLPLNSLNPNNIESVTVLKDQSASVAYGELGKNGIILITTKDFLILDSPEPQKLEPLILVNGEVYMLELSTLNPKEIKTITVLKDKSATNIYGEAGKNGVILVTTSDNIKLK
jgi:TonB-dependent SusC/RagA subfamily outer membrane receptor